MTVADRVWKLVMAIASVGVYEGAGCRFCGASPLESHRDGCLFIEARALLPLLSSTLPAQTGFDLPARLRALVETWREEAKQGRAGLPALGGAPISYQAASATILRAERDAAALEYELAAAAQGVENDGK